MKIDVLLGLQWGDEGKGKIVDVLCPKYDVVARFQGGPNAGHTLEIGDLKTVLHTIPSGVFGKNTKNIIGNGVVLDPVIFKKEIENLIDLNVDLKQTLIISEKAHLIVPTHRLLDKASEESKGKSKIGSTLKGIGPTYMDKTGRNGLRVGDILLGNFKDKFQTLKQKHQKILNQYNFTETNEDYENQWFEAVEFLKQFQIVDSVYLMDEYSKNNKKVLAEGAQGTLLDIDFGSYPYVTSSNTICAGACTGLGVAPSKIGEVIGIVKAYCTRVGSGPFPTELFDETGKQIQQIGHEFGATTGRERRCGWLDLITLRYTCILNGVTQIILTKADVLNSFDTLKVCTAYKLKNGTTTNELPYDMEEVAEPIYKEFPGWNQNIDASTPYEELPKNLLEYIAFIEKELNVPIKVISVGPDRSETIFK